MVKSLRKPIIKKDNLQPVNEKKDTSNKKVLWIIYDALDPDYLEKEINNEKVFNNVVTTIVFHRLLG